jgi:hypothetical protein
LSLGGGLPGGFSGGSSGIIGLSGTLPGGFSGTGFAPGSPAQGNFGSGPSVGFSFNGTGFSPAGGGFGSGFSGAGFQNGGGFNFTGGRRFNFTIDVWTPVKDLLPPAPPATRPSGPLLHDSLASVPEVQLLAPPSQSQALRERLALRESLKQTPAAEKPDAGQPGSKSLEEMAHMIAKLSYLNTQKPDGAVEALLYYRPDLAGLPVAMGNACRTSAERSKHFADAVSLVRSIMRSNLSGGGKGNGAEAFWRHWRSVCAKQDTITDGQPAQAAHVAAARVAALMQMLATESAAVRVGLAKHLATVPHVDATRALARLAVFSAEAEVRHAAIDALALRRERDYTDTLVRGLRYPWPAAARHAGEAIIKLQRTDLVPQLVALLDEPDPRDPFLQDAGPKQVPAVRELVRINHHRNCLLCHAPGSQVTGVPNGVLTAPVPLPDQSLSRPSGGYQQSSSPPDIFVRVDTNYLRQDFSLMERVVNSAPWPAMQRFDYLVRTRTLSDDEAAAWRAALRKGPARVTPYQRIALGALRELTGRDAAPSAEAWRKVLSQPGSAQAPGRPAKPQPAAWLAMAFLADQAGVRDTFRARNLFGQWLLE